MVHRRDALNFLLGVLPMTIASTRAQAVADILWELKKADKLATLTAVAGRAGFSPGPRCNTISSCLKNVRRDWPHLEWWRVVSDNGQLDAEQAACLTAGGYGISGIGSDRFEINQFDEQLLTWEVVEAAEE
jgi:alkylated DNA nucleotide flippase Atl1